MAVDLTAMSGPGMPDFDYFGRWGSGAVFAVFAAVVIAAAFRTPRCRTPVSGF
jgi:hypothetical protein